MGLKTPKPSPRAYPNEIRTLGEEVRFTRLERGLMQSEVAQLLQVPDSNISHLECSAHTKDVRMLYLATKFLGYIPRTLKIQICTERGQLFAYRIQNNLNLKALGRELEINDQTLGRFERGLKIKEESRTKIHSFLKNVTEANQK